MTKTACYFPTPNCSVWRAWKGHQSKKSLLMIHLHGHNRGMCIRIWKEKYNEFFLYFFFVMRWSSRPAIWSWAITFSCWVNPHISCLTFDGHIYFHACYVQHCHLIFWLDEYAFKIGLNKPPLPANGQSSCINI